MEKIIKKSQYLYDVDGTIFKNMKYLEALEYKIRLTKILVDKLQDSHYSKRDFYRIGKVIDAQKFNQALIDEAEGKI